MGVRVFVIHRPISRDEIGFPLEPKHTGAILEYFHIVRQEGGDSVHAMQFDGDREFLKSQLTEAARKVTTDYELTDFECLRRVGQVPIGEPCLLVRIAALHRHEAFRAMDEFLTVLKEIDIPAQPARH